MKGKGNTAHVKTKRHHSRENSGLALTDCGNAERLVEQHGESILFSQAMREWLVWNGCCWVVDPGGIVQLAKKTVRAMRLERRYLEYQADEYPERWDALRAQADALSKWAKRSEGAPQIAAMVHLAQSDPRISATPDKFDRSPWILNVMNGTIDLRTGELGPHKPKDFLTKITDTNYKAGDPCDRWTRFLEEVFEPHPEIIPFLQKAIGYSLTGNVQEECVFVLVGDGRNGKGTLIDVLHHLLGSYGGVAEIETFLTSHRSPLREDIADMRGRRMISSQEPTLAGTFAESTLKWLSGGDRLRARRLYEHAQEFHP
jgi:putative DNA primase/helicase